MILPLDSICVHLRSTVRPHLNRRKGFCINAFQRMLSDGRRPLMEPRFERRKEQLLKDCQVPPALFGGALDRLNSFVQPFVTAMPSPESRRHAQTYLCGLLSDVERKNAESIAYRYDLDRQPIQRFIGEVPWDHGPLLDELASQVVREIGRNDAVLVLDPSAFPKKGDASVAVKKQWCGRLDQVANCQVGIYLAYVTDY